MTAATIDVARLLEDLKRGAPGASAELMTLVYRDLQRLARAQRGVAPGDPTLNTTSLVHECYLRIVDPLVKSVETKHHFYNLASRVMRQVLCDHAREHLAQKRGAGREHDSLSAADAEIHAEAAGLVEIDGLLNRLEQEHPSYARVFECRYFAGLSEQETADALALSLRTAQREWHLARQWLASRLQA